MPEKSTIEVLIDKESINIPVGKYNELVKKALKLEILETMYQNAESYTYSTIFETMFGSKNKEGDNR